MIDLSDSFLERLKAYDEHLRAHYDPREDAIFVWSERPGKPKVHELTVRRQFAENYRELEGRTLAKLPICDVWRRFGNGKAYDNYLAEEEEKFRREGRERFRKERMAMWKDKRPYVEAAVWNAQHGRFTKATAQPYKTPSVSLFIPGKDEKENSK